MEQQEKNELFDDFKAISARVVHTALPVNGKKPTATLTSHEPSQSPLSMMMAETKETFYTQPGIGATGISIEEIISLIRPPFEVVRDHRGCIYDTATIAVKCKISHRHRYFIKDIQMGILSCNTCGHGTKTARRIRETFEEVLNVPFVVTNSPTVSTMSTMSTITTYIYVNPPLGITIEYRPVIMESTCDNQNGKVRITMGKHSTVSKIKADIGKFLLNYPRLSSEQLANVTSLVPRVVELKKKIVLVPKPLPFTSQVADTIPLIVKHRMTVINDSRLLIENT